ncbi:MAG: hypothetical protein OHK0029_22830 [Armatimonadaceae bacterium]
MQEPEYSVFRPEHRRYHLPRRIGSLGPYLPTTQVMDATGALRYIREGNDTGYSTGSVTEMERAVRWTRWVNALNAGRKWARQRLFERLDALLDTDIALITVPSHDPFHTDPPIRDLAKLLAETPSRTDATRCLIRHTKIKRISYGGPSYRTLHRETIRVENIDLFAGRSVLLLDDIVRSGASLRTCEELLYEAGAAFVQSFALGRVTATAGTGYV